MAPEKHTESDLLAGEWLLRNLRLVPKLLHWLITGQFQRASSATKPFLRRLFPTCTRSGSPLQGTREGQARATKVEASIELIDASKVLDIGSEPTRDITVVMPCIDAQAGGDTARLLARRAGIACRVIVVMDRHRQGFIRTLNQTAACVSSRYVVYLAQDAYPGRRWLRDAYDILEKTKKGLLGFNDGKWQGRIAAFGMVRVDWVKHIYGGPILCPAYKSHYADKELTVIAGASNQYIYDPNVVLVEYDPNKDAKRVDVNDKSLFARRFATGFEGTISLESLDELAAEFSVREFHATR